MGYASTLPPPPPTPLTSYPPFTEKRVERAKAGDPVDGTTSGLAPPAHSLEGSPAGSDVPGGTTPHIGSTPLEARPSLDDSMMLDAEDGSGGPMGLSAKRDAHPPARPYRLTDQMKGLIWQLVCFSNECCRIENEKK